MRAQAQVVVDFANSAVAAKDATIKINTSAQTTFNTFTAGWSANSKTLYEQLLTAATQSNTSATQAESYYNQAVAAAALVNTDPYALDTAKTYLLVAKNAATDARASANATAMLAVSGQAYVSAYVVVDIANSGVAAKNATVAVLSESNNALLAMNTTPNNVELQQLINAKALEANTQAFNAANFETQARDAAKLVDATVLAAVTIANQAVQVAQAATVAAQEAGKSAQANVSNAQTLMDASIVIQIAINATTSVADVQKIFTDAQTALGALEKQPDSLDLAQTIQSLSEQTTELLQYVSTTRADALTVQANMGTYAPATDLVTKALASIQASIDTITALDTQIRDMLITAQTYLLAAPVLALVQSALTLENQVNSLGLDVQLLTITVNNAMSSVAMEVPLQQAIEKSVDMRDVTAQLGQVKTQADSLLNSVQGDATVVNLARDARNAVATSYTTAQGAYSTMQTLLSAAQETYRAMVAKEEQFRVSMVAAGTQTMNAIVADATNALRTAQNTNDAAKRSLMQIEPVTTNSAVALPLLAQLDDGARVVNMAAATLRADVLLAQQVQTDYAAYITFDQVMTTLRANVQIAQDLAQATLAIASRARELTMAKIASESSLIDSLKLAEQTATVTVLPDVRSQKEAFAASFAAAQAAFASIQTLLRGATARRLQPSSATSAEINDMLQTLLIAYDSANLAYQDILFLYNTIVAYLTPVLQSDLSFTTDTAFQQSAAQTLQEVTTIKNTAEASLATMNTYVANVRKSLADAIAAEIAEAARIAAEKAAAERLEAQRIAAAILAQRLRELEQQRLAARQAKKQQFVDNLNPKYDEAGKPTMGRTLVTVALVLVIIGIVILLLKRSNVF